MSDRAASWDEAPSGLLVLAGDGTVLDANTTLLQWVGRPAADVLGRVRLSQLLSVGGRIYWETHLSPLLHVEGRVDEVALELRGPDGRVPVLMTAVVAPDGLVRVAVSSARDRSRYERELLAARKDADAAAQRTRVLQDVTAALSAAVGRDGVASALLGTTPSLGARAATCWLTDARGRLVAHSVTGEETGTPGTLPPRSWPRTALVDAGRVLVPLHGRSGLLGVLSLLPDDGAGAEPPDLAMLTAVGQQAGAALDRASLFDRSAAIAHQLQQALLTAPLPQDERVVVSTSYRPGVESLEVGGDWHDAFHLDDDVLGVAVGDVVGRGLDAAIAMGQLRSAVRAVAGPGIGPAGVLGALDRFVRRVPDSTSATLLYGELDLVTGRFRFACAGHLPPLLLERDGTPRLVWDGRSTPLGLTAPGSERPEAAVDLVPGDRLLLYTDGLVERRDRPLPTRLDELVEVGAQTLVLGPEEAVQAVTDRLLPPGEGHDDVCLLLLAWHGPA
ncbi:Serine phosphatase RsbU, regulator of sigma subunit [Georgenia satyanarayanai]|uniref:Serine phosphatase RsbU, regulator of sigma subunit n=1 Tax=Georgenia satyanarayanai TaxID=860221 RepID=A0A2Y9A859_9MICO|nr:SpoIIE family protein phosphatase [Georgenia satyanarayanai]PYG00289.1 serine phosphatase RsbU (regulator of sigma subunit) [Georgenia satyanarayanai]SSA40674.1 Serine phosphatase RsbU, regulator of sigma subunit [Georgenia satyanarayanai]